MHAFRYARADLQHELLQRARAERIPVTIDAAGFLVVDSRDDHARLEDIRTSIDNRLLKTAWYWSAESDARCAQERAVILARGVPFHEYESITDDLPQALLDQGGTISHQYGLAIRNESSLPIGQRPWDRK